jgi:hypothetical protein
VPNKLSARVSEHDRRPEQHDREIAAIRKLILRGMKMLVENERQIKEANKTLDRFIRSLERGGNGKGGLG